MVFYLEYVRRSERPLLDYLADRVTDLDLDKRDEMATAYHIIISTLKLHGKSAWHDLGRFFTKIFNGCRDFLSLTPGNIEIAVCQ